MVQILFWARGMKCKYNLMVEAAIMCVPKRQNSLNRWWDLSPLLILVVSKDKVVELEGSRRTLRFSVLPTQLSKEARSL